LIVSDELDDLQNEIGSLECELMDLQKALNDVNEENYKLTDKIDEMKEGAILDIENFKRVLSIRGLLTPELENFIEDYLRWSNE
jgi:predicted  nucleic acid-binding Zn-ribbon protein